MKKIILSLSFLFFTFCFVNAQSFSLSWDGEVLGDTVTVFPDTVGASLITFHAIFTNHTNNGVNIKVVRNEIFIMEGDTSYFCWGVCYLPQVDTSGMFMEIPAGGPSGDLDFSAYYMLHSAIGVGLVEYKFYDMDNPDEFVKVIAEYDNTPSSIDENILKNIWVSDLYPNPATNYVIIDYDMPAEVKEASVKIVNLLGSVVKEQKIDVRNNNMKLDIIDLNGGIYFYSINVNGEIFRTKKLIIR